MELSGVALFKITAEVNSELDYSKGFGHADPTAVDDADRAAS